MHLTIHDVIAVIRRRKNLLFLSLILVTSICTIGAFLLPRQYQSSTTILVQRDQVLNPLVSFSMAVTIASEDRLKTFNEIVYSRSTIQLLVDSLKLAPPRQSEEERQILIEEVQTRIETERRGSESFLIIFTDTHPFTAQQGALLLANHFIKTVLAVENQRNEEAVKFFESKLEDLRMKFEDTQQKVVATLKERLTELPVESRSLYTNIEDVEKHVGSLNDRLHQYQEEMAVLKSFPRAMESEEGKKALFALLRTDLPYVTDLRPLLLKYEELTRRYKSTYPEVGRLTRQILDLINTIRTAVEAEIPKIRSQVWDLEKRRNAYVEDLKKSSVSARIDEAKMANYDVYRGLYDEMKIKLEQARTSRDLGRQGGEQFIIIDPPLVPTEPTKPNRLLMILGGFGLGLVLGIISIATSEILDTTIRSQRDVGTYRKPILAFLPARTQSAA